MIFFIGIRMWLNCISLCCRVKMWVIFVCLRNVSIMCCFIVSILFLIVVIGVR